MLLTLSCPILSHFATVLFCQNTKIFLADISSRQYGLSPSASDPAPPPAAAGRPRQVHPSLPPSSQSHPVPSIKPEIGRLARHLLRRTPPERELAPPQFRGTWQPNRPYTPRERGADADGRGRTRTDADGRGRRADCYLSELEVRRGDVKQVYEVTGMLRCEIEKG